jgi:transcriptional regulator with XRE-family HTH domain
MQALNLHVGVWPPYAHCKIMQGMAAPYFKQWRKFRDLTQEQVIDRLSAMDDPLIPQTAASLSRLENGKQAYTQRSLEALAEVYQCEPDHLLGRNPFKEGEVIDLWTQLTERQQRQALAVIDAIRRESA